MAQPTPSKPLTSFPRGALRVVLFGMPDAGKSSLLGALAQAADTQADILKVKLNDPTGGLEELQRRLYEEQARRTPEEVVPYVVKLEPFPARAGEAAPPPFDVVLVDCDGRAANEILVRQRNLNGSPAEGPLGHAVLNADTLILAVDASASQEVLNRDFGQFARFLRLLEESRSQRTDVGGLPVYLVLTKCDLLAKKGDSAVAWMERIEERKRTVDRKFQEYLAQHAAREARPFGRINLHLWATAVKRPALGENPPKPREPYGVAELFRQGVDSAWAYRGRRAAARRRLTWTLAGLVALVGLMLILGLYFWASRQAFDVSTLEQAIRIVRSDEERLKEADARRGWLENAPANLKQLQRLRDDPAFPEVGEEQQRWVEENLKELQAYEAYRKEVLNRTEPAPRFARTEKSLKEQIAALDKLAPPKEYADAWARARAVWLREQWLKEARLLQREINTAAKGYQALLDEWAKLDPNQLTVTKYQELRRGLLKKAANLPYYKGNKEHLPNAQMSTTYHDVLQFERVADLYREWLAVSRKDG